MFSLKSIAGVRFDRAGARGEGRHAGGLALPALVDHLVLPRLLRRPVRWFSRVFCGDARAPHFAMSAATAVLFSATGAFGAYQSGQLPAYAQAVTGRTGFAIDQIRVSGEKQTSEIDILGALELDGWTALVGFNADAARDRILGLPWIKAASVRKIYPDQIEVKVVEREPFAIWQQGTQLSLVERDGSIVMPFEGGSRFATLPLVIGYGAAGRAADFMQTIGRFPDLATQVRAYIRVADRRWDVKLKNGVTLKLPEQGVDLAVARALKMNRDMGLFDRDLAAVDLRMDDRVVVELTPDAAVRRDQQVQDEIKAAKKRAGKQT